MTPTKNVLTALRPTKSVEKEVDPKNTSVVGGNAPCHFIEPNPEDVTRVCGVERDPPLQIYFDYETIMDDNGVQTLILLGAESNEEDHTEFFYGADYTESFLEWLESLAVDQDGNNRSVLPVFHNLKGYNRMSLLQNCSANHQEVTDNITMSTKVLSFKSDRLTSNDSLCFFFYKEKIHSASFPFLLLPFFLPLTSMN